MQRRLRLRHTRDFQRLRQEGQVLKHPTMLFSYAPNDLDQNRYGFITPKRIGNAVTRNRIRRQVREALRLLHPRLQQGYDIVVIVHVSLIGKPFFKIQRILCELCERAKLLKELPTS